ncbi:MAG TPA: class I SAM-dependent methyltransferase [Pyrinomonadaceae bacterium]|jgi:protein arginine N-methyltransferase 1|nr:class I SAM-dependent methyltransferase [Pyrinomonadaceae bacterium]
MYSLHFYGRMLADTARMNAYVEALRRSVRPDSVVLDLGSGPGVFALLACKFGARRVYAVEPDSTITIAREAAAANGFADRIEFFQALSTEVTLPEPATVIISDLRGVLPWFQQHIPAIIDARKRLLAAGGTLIPGRDFVWGSVIEAPEAYEEIVGPWVHNQFDLNLSAGASRITNTWRKTRIKAGELLTEAICWTTLDYYEADSADVGAEISWRVARSGTAHGIAVWFDAETAEGIAFTNRPGSEELIYGQGFFPFPRPVQVTEGERIHVRLRADLIEDDYVWSWTTDFTDQKIGFKQSTFYSVALSLEEIKKKYAQHS